MYMMCSWAWDVGCRMEYERHLRENGVRGDSKMIVQQKKKKKRFHVTRMGSGRGDGSNGHLIGHISSAPVATENAKS